ncbi:Calcium-independent phospholipase A2-gamma [Orchesella cincta]|uniref:Calcium-independent phospholipase A2-gamma n=1 Tax=Orchesella cincta TaxID=48709 RepID=A0A1D2NET1_ORCCI|nr:Calcium-independent phospholipase A2-gamma [Orchesella cincta]
MDFNSRIETMSSGSNFGNNDSQVTKQMSQATLRLKALSQLRQVLKTSPSRAGIAYSFGKDLFILLRYLPAGLLNKIQNFSSTNNATPGGTDSGNGDSLVSGNSTAPPTPSKGPDKNKKEIDGAKPLKATSISLPATPTKSRASPSLISSNDISSVLQNYADTRNTALETGAVKVISRIMKTFPDNTHIVGRSREVLALLGVSPPIKGHGIKILSIDGGGVRGLVSLEVLRVIERITQRRTHELFDYICGVSTGSILAFLLGAHRHSLDDAEAMYKDLSREIFSQNSFWGNATLVWSHAYYHTPTFERILKKHCGEVPLISLARDPDLPRVSAISTVVNQERVSPYVFRTYAFPPTVKEKYFGGCRYHMWESVRASAAAPTYFEEFKLGNYLHQDGGIIVNNPTAVAIGEARTLWKDSPIQCVVSLGTGLSLSSRTDRKLNEFIEQGEGGASYLSWKGKFLKVLDSATDTESVHNTLNELLPNDIYFRFNPYLSEVVRLDETKPEIIAKVQSETREYLERNVEKVQFVCKTLLKEKGLSKKVVDWWYKA